jgi:hypothetical protein
MDAVYSTKPRAAALVAACHSLTAINCATKPNSGHETVTPDLPSPTDDADAWNAFTHCVFLFAFLGSLYLPVETTSHSRRLESFLAPL